MSPPSRRQRRRQSTSRTAPPEAVFNPIATVQYPPTSNASLLNFVDASILSKLELPTFDGNILEYPEFSSRFATLVGSKVQLDDTTKFSLLKSCLRGRALQSIQGLSMTPGNYKIALDILATHYDDKVTMKHILYTKLAQLPNCDPEGRNLQTIYNQMFALVRQFSDGEDDCKETGLGAILLNKLPARVRSQIYDRTGNKHNLTPTELLNLLTDIVRKEATLFEMEYHAHPSYHFQSYGFHASSRSSPDKTLPHKHKKMRPCPFCQGNDHVPNACVEFPTPQERSRLVKQLRLCYNCLSNKHSLKECTSKQSCKSCAKRHHSSLCFGHPSLSDDGKGPSQGSIPSPPNQFAAQPHQQFSATTTNETHADSHLEENNMMPIPPIPTPLTSQNHELSPVQRTPATLMCTLVRLFNPSNTSKESFVTAFFDSGSSQSYITDEVAELLELPNLSFENISVSTFGTAAPLKLRSRNHVVAISTEKGDKQLYVKSLPTLTGHLSHAHHTHDIGSDDITISSSKPSILIGNDYFWDIILSDDFHYEKLPNGYRSLHTTVGNVLVGSALNSEGISTCRTNSKPKNRTRPERAQRQVSNNKIPSNETLTSPANADTLHGPWSPTVVVASNTAVLHGQSGSSVISTETASTSRTNSASESRTKYSSRPRIHPKRERQQVTEKPLRQISSTPANVDIPHGPCPVAIKASNTAVPAVPPGPSRTPIISTAAPHPTTNTLFVEDQTPKTASEIKSRQSEAKLRQDLKFSGQTTRSPGTAVNLTNFFSPTSALGNRLLNGIDKISWNLLNNVSSDTAAPPRLATARSQTPSTKTAQLASKPSKEKKSQNFRIDEFLHKPASEQQKQSASPLSHSEATPHAKRKDVVSFQSFWLLDSTQQPQYRDSFQTARARTPLDARAREGSKPPAYQFQTPACTAIKDSMPRTPLVTKAAEIPMFPTPRVHTPMEKPMSPTRGVDTTEEISTAPRKSTNIFRTSQTNGTTNWTEGHRLQYK